MIILDHEQIDQLKAKAQIEADRDVYSIRVEGQYVFINGSWGVERSETDVNQSIITAIEEYCSQKNIDWEWQAEYSAWCD